MLYLAVGIALGPAGAGLLQLDTIENSYLLERMTEIAVIASLFTAGLKLRLPITDVRWRPALSLATISMGITIALVAAVGRYLLDLPWGAGVLLGAVLAPTDPVLASDVQVEHPHDQNNLRFGLTAEAGLNDGTAFPFVMLGLGVIGLHNFNGFSWEWFAVDVLWAVSTGLLIGGTSGFLIARLVLYLRRKHKEAIGFDDFLALGLIGLSYGLALLAHGYGFLAVFAAGVAMRTVELKDSGRDRPELNADASAEGSTEEMATHPEKAPAYMAHALLRFNEQVERVGEVTVVIVIGSLLRLDVMMAQPFWFVPLLFLVIRPIAVVLGLAGSHLTRREVWLMSWFGIRGIGSLYYITYAIQNKLPTELATRMAGLTLFVIAASTLLHGVSVTPLMQRYRAQER